MIFCVYNDISLNNLKLIIIKLIIKVNLLEINEFHFRNDGIQASIVVTLQTASVVDRNCFL